MPLSLLLIREVDVTIHVDHKVVRLLKWLQSLCHSFHGEDGTATPTPPPRNPGWLGVALTIV